MGIKVNEDWSGLGLVGIRVSEGGVGLVKIIGQWGNERRCGRENLKISVVDCGAFFATLIVAESERTRTDSTDSEKLLQLQLVTEISGYVTHGKLMLFTQDWSSSVGVQWAIKCL